MGCSALVHWYIQYSFVFGFPGDRKLPFIYLSSIQMRSRLLNTNSEYRVGKSHNRKSRTMKPPYNTGRGHWGCIGNPIILVHKHTLKPAYLCMH